MNFPITLKEERDASLIVFALRVAAVQYTIDADLNGTNARLNKTFLAQAERARDIANEIEEQIES